MSRRNSGSQPDLKLLETDTEKYFKESNMCREDIIENVLGILAKNVESSSRPGLVGSSFIADELNMTLEETKEILKTMDVMGTIKCSLETDYSLITTDGLKYIKA